VVIRQIFTVSMFSRIISEMSFLLRVSERAIQPNTTLGVLHGVIIPLNLLLREQLLLVMVVLNLLLPTRGLTLSHWMVFDLDIDWLFLDEEALSGAVVYSLCFQ